MKFYNGINKVEKVLVAIVTVLLVAVVFLQVVNRTIIKATIAWPEEAARYLMVWQVFLASVIAFRTGANCCIDVLINRFHGKAKVVLTCFSNIVCLVFAVVLILGGTGGHPDPDRIQPDLHGTADQYGLCLCGHAGMGVSLHCRAGVYDYTGF